MARLQNRKRGPGRPKDDGLPARRRKQILGCAIEVFAEQGYRNTDVQTIADQLGISKGTIYNYFDSKRDLFLASVDEGMNQLSDQIHSAADAESDPLKQIEVGITMYLAFFDAHPNFVELFIQERAEFRDRPQPIYFQHAEANTDQWRALYQQLIDEGRLRDIPVQRIIDVIGDLVYGTIFTNYQANRRISFKQQARDILDIFFNGILTRPTGQDNTP